MRRARAEDTPGGQLLISENSVMISLLRPLLATCLYLLLPGGHGRTLTFSNGFHYQDISNGKSSREMFSNAVRLHVESTQPAVSAITGSSVILPCHYRYEPVPATPRRTRVKWSRLPSNSISTGVFSVASARETEVMVAMGDRHRSYGNFRGRVRLRRSAPGDLSLVINELQVNDTGIYRCEVIDGLEDESVTVELGLQGVVFPYYGQKGRYQYNFFSAQKACQNQEATLATFEQLFTAWEEGLDWCNAGWLADGTVQYPITNPRDKCGGPRFAPGLRNYGRPDRLLNLYDAFCFSASITGTVYLLNNPTKLNFTEAVQACVNDGSQIAKVGQVYVAWRLMGLDHCVAGWLADGSVRYPIRRARTNCGSTAPGVRSFGFPPLSQTFDVYCCR